MSDSQPEPRWLVGELVWIRDLETHGLITDIITDEGVAYCCQIGDTGEGDWAAVHEDNVEPPREVRFTVDTKCDPDEIVVTKGLEGPR